MKNLQLSEIPTLISNGKLSKKEAVDYLALFIFNNFSIFKITNYDDDFITDVVTDFLENGEAFINNYIPEKSQFFTYFYSHVISIIKFVTKKKNRQLIREFYAIQESINNYDNEIDAYSRINYKDFDKPKIPYYYKPYSINNFSVACQKEKYTFKNFLNNTKDDNFSELRANLQKTTPIMARKILIVLALKSSYYISDEQIVLICRICNIKEESFRQIILDIKSNLEKREKSKQKFELRRNKAYYNHRQYKAKLNYIESNNDEITKYYKADMNKKFNKETKSWENLNKHLQIGYVNLRPTNKTIAEILGICERQVSYYIQNAKRLGIKI